MGPRRGSVCPSPSFACRLPLSPLVSSSQPPTTYWFCPRRRRRRRWMILSSVTGPSPLRSPSSATPVPSTSPRPVGRACLAPRLRARTCPSGLSRRLSACAMRRACTSLCLHAGSKFAFQRRAKGRRHGDCAPRAPFHRERECECETLRNSLQAPPSRYDPHDLLRPPCLCQPPSYLAHTSPRAVS